MLSVQGKVIKPIPAPVPLFSDVAPSLAADVTSLWMYYQLFGEPLRLSSFSLDDFTHALLYPGGDSSLITQCLLSTFKLLMKDEKARARRAAADSNSAVLFERRKERNLDADEDDKHTAAGAGDGKQGPTTKIDEGNAFCASSVWSIGIDGVHHSGEDALLSLARQVGLDDELNAGNWQELLRWYIYSKLDTVSMLELNSRLVALKQSDTAVAASVTPADPAAPVASAEPPAIKVPRPIFHLFAKHALIPAGVFLCCRRRRVRMHRTTLTWT